MKLAVLHYHLDRSGVTQVIENHIRAVDAVLPRGETWQVAVLSGRRRKGWPEDLPDQSDRIRLTLHDVPLLDYDGQRDDVSCPGESLADAVRKTLADIDFRPEETVLHIHNHALGKNAALPAAVTQLAEEGYALVLQPHDFAEDFRPAEFQRLRSYASDGRPPDSWHGTLYPQAGHVHYAVLNGRDQRILQAAGVARDRVHLLPNPVLPKETLPAKEPVRRRLAERFRVGKNDRFLLYPVRCIRRKNIGEAILYGLLAGERTVVGMTLPTLNPNETAIYGQWKEFAEQRELPCRFELGVPGGLSFAENLAAADRIVTSSVAEGFGMVFLEAWLAGRVLAGRDLPEITRDFTAAGVVLDPLQPQVHVPVAWIGREAFRHTLLDAYHRTLASYGQPAPAGIHEELAGKTAGGVVDFADLNESQQQEVIRKVAASDADRSRLIQLNRKLVAALTLPGSGDDLIRRNVAAIERHFALPPSGQRLVELYRRVHATPRKGRPVPLAAAPRILESFLDLRRFRLIRSLPGQDAPS